MSEKHGSVHDTQSGASDKVDDVSLARPKSDITQNEHAADQQPRADRIQRDDNTAAAGASNQGRNSKATRRRRPRYLYPFRAFSYGPEIGGEAGSQDDRLRFDHDPGVNAQKVLEYADQYNAIQFQQWKLINLSKYDDITSYGIQEQQESRLWKIEIQRLLESTSSRGPNLFSSAGRFGSATQEGFKAVSDVSDQIQCNSATINHDNSWIDKSDKHHRSEKRFYKKCKDCLETRSSESNDDVDVDENGFRCVRPTILKEHNQELYFMLVDYITAILARYLFRCASSELWHNLCFSILAKWAAKSKILSKDPVKFASLSLEAAEDNDDEKEQYEYAKFVDNPTLQRTKEEPYSPINSYHSFESTIRDVLQYQFMHISKYSLRSEHSSQTSDSLATSTRVYRTGQGRSHTVISSDTEGEFSASTGPKELRYTRSAIDILVPNLRAIDQRPRLPVGPITAEGTHQGRAVLCYRWEVQGEQEARDEIVIETMDDVLSFLVPHALCSAHVSTETKMMIFSVRAQSQLWVEKPVDEYVDQDHTAKFSLTTTAFQEKKLDQTVSSKDAVMLDSRILPGISCSKSEITPSSNSWISGLSELAHPTKSDADSFEIKMRKTDIWQFDEKAVIVPCRLYVWTCLGFSMISIAGGSAVPFTTRVRLPGVDPFNIATFVWLFVAFGSFLAQSRYVPYWAWHDFLHGRIVCHTVTESANVSNLDPQLVLHKLLVSEKSTVLSTRGPYNSMFRRTAIDGFSIDVPCTTATLYASGYVLFLGIGRIDRYILCADARPDSEILQANHHNWDERLGCRSQLDASTDQSKLPVLKLESTDLQSDRVLGSYVGDRRFG